VSSLALDFTGVTVRLDPAVMLEPVHQLGTSTGLVARVDVSSYQLKHPESLPPELADMFGIDVEVRRGSADAVTVSLNRDAPEASLDLPFGFSDLVARRTPGPAEVRVPAAQRGDQGDRPVLGLGIRRGQEPARHPGHLNTREDESEAGHHARDRGEHRWFDDGRQRRRHVDDDLG
jgi:hypothetical protein